MRPISASTVASAWLTSSANSTIAAFTSLSTGRNWTRARAIGETARRCETLSGADEPAVGVRDHAHDCAQRALVAAVERCGEVRVPDARADLGFCRLRLGVSRHASTTAAATDRDERSRWLVDEHISSFGNNQGSLNYLDRGVHRPLVTLQVSV